MRGNFVKEDNQMGAFFDNLRFFRNDRYDLERLKIELSSILRNRGFSLLQESSDGDVSLMIYEPDDNPLGI